MAFETNELVPEELIKSFLKKDELQKEKQEKKETTEAPKLFYQKLATFVLRGQSVNVDNVDIEKLQEVFAELLITLTPRERDVLRIRLGMDDGRMRTLEEVGQLFGVTKESIRLIETRALRKLRFPNCYEQLRQFFGNENIKPLSEL